LPGNYAITGLTGKAQSTRKWRPNELFPAGACAAWRRLLPGHLFRSTLTARPARWQQASAR